ncbi:MAG: hypothetical protein ACPLX8_00900 [Nanopusillaceae archaeon]
MVKMVKQMLKEKKNQKREKQININGKNFTKNDAQKFVISFTDKLYAEILDSGMYEFLKNNLSLIYPELKYISVEESNYVDENFILTDFYSKITSKVYNYVTKNLINYKYKSTENLEHYTERLIDKYAYSEILRILKQGYNSGKLSINSKLYKIMESKGLI